MFGACFLLLGSCWETRGAHRGGNGAESQPAVPVTLQPRCRERAERRGPGWLGREAPRDCPSWAAFVPAALTCCCSHTAAPAVSLILHLLCTKHLSAREHRLPLDCLVLVQDGVSFPGNLDRVGVCLGAGLALGQVHVAVTSTRNPSSSAAPSAGTPATSPQSNPQPWAGTATEPLLPWG